MTRRHIPMLAAAAAAALIMLVPATASARLTELGAPSGTSIPAPSCPTSPCLAITRTTGFQLQMGTVRTPFTVPRTGRIVAFTVRLGRPSARQIDFFNQQSGGKARVRIATLRPVSAPRGQIRYQLVAQTDPFPVERYFGRTVQFPLRTTLLARRRWVVALSVDTWAPTLAINGLSNSFSWRASRVKPCSDNPERQPPHTTPGSVRQYFCTYRPARLTYSATLISTP